MNLQTSVVFLAMALMVFPVWSQPPKLASNMTSSDVVRAYMNSLYKNYYNNMKVSREVVCEWKNNLEFEWPCDYVKGFYQSRGLFDSEESKLQGIDRFKNEMFVTLYRRSKKVPSGLNVVVKENDQFILRPFPSLSMNEVGNCSNLLFPVRTATDQENGLMYVIDAGSDKESDMSLQSTTTTTTTTATATTTTTTTSTTTTLQTCPPKLVVLDLNKNGEVLRSHNLQSGTTKDSSSLSDIILDYGSTSNTKVTYAYITDSRNASIIVFDFATNTSWSFRHESLELSHLPERIKENGPTIGLAISRKLEFVYYGVAGGRQMSQIPTFVLRNRTGDFAGNHRYVGNVNLSGAIACGKKGLYYGAGDKSAVYRWSIPQDVWAQQTTEDKAVIQSQTQIMNDTIRDYWIERMTLDKSGYLWVTTSAVRTEPDSGPKFKIHKIFVDDTSVLVKD